MQFANDAALVADLKLCKLASKFGIMQIRKLQLVNLNEHSLLHMHMTFITNANR